MLNLKCWKFYLLLQYYALPAEKSFHTYASPKKFKEMHIKGSQRSQKLFVLTSRINVKVQESLYNKLSDLDVR